METPTVHPHATSLRQRDCQALVSVLWRMVLYGNHLNTRLVPPFNVIVFSISVYTRTRDTRTLYTRTWSRQRMQCHHSSNVPVNVNRRTNRERSRQRDIVTVSSVLTVLRKKMIRSCCVPILRTGIM